MNIQHVRKGEKGIAHLLIVIVDVVVLVGVLGFIGYNALQKKTSNAGNEATLGRTGSEEQEEELVPDNTEVSDNEQAKGDNELQDTTSSGSSSTTQTPKACTKVNVPTIGYPELDNIGVNVVDIKDKGNYTYPVYGFTRVQVLAQLKKCGLLYKNKISFYGVRYTYPLMRIWARYNEQANTCTVTAASIRYKIYTFNPMWTANSKADPKINATMKNWIEAIRTRDNRYRAVVKQEFNDAKKYLDASREVQAQYPHNVDFQKY